MKVTFTSSKVSKIISLVKTLPWVAEGQILDFLGLSNKPSLFFVTPDANWSTDWDGYYITRGLRQIGLNSMVISTPHLLSNEILHYSDLGTCLHHIDQPWSQRNRVVMTFFHGDRRFPEFIPLIDKFIQYKDCMDMIVTSNKLMKNRIVEWGIEDRKIKCIPLGVDLTRFQPVALEQKMALRDELGIPQDAVCIGSFQKDGVGWKDGLEPKLVKGPDIFLRVVQKLKTKHNIHVLLSAPARGYVKSGLDSLGIPYHHYIYKNYLDIVKLYQALDIYLVTSREEGGPKAILEAMACGIPLVSTRVGMVPDVLIDNFNGLSVENENVDGLIESVEKMLGDSSLAVTCVKNGLETVKSYHWPIIAQKYHDDVYFPLLKQ